jgi:hypothetical protein
MMAIETGKIEENHHDTHRHEMSSTERRPQKKRWMTIPETENPPLLHTKSAPEVLE